MHAERLLSGKLIVSSSPYNSFSIVAVELVKGLGQYSSVKD
jgi:hypothetical protein